MLRFSNTLLFAATCLLMMPDSVTPCARCVTVTACEHSYAILRCGVGQKISVYYANYGRHDRTTCSHYRPASQLQNVHCSRPTPIVAEKCNGRNTCSVRASNSVFGDPCFGTYKYLEVTYTCAFTVTACEHSYRLLRCGLGQEISVYYANYGRHDRTTCSHNRPASQIQNVHCSSPTTVVAEKCNGRKTCLVQANYLVFGDPCYGTYKYLEVTYACVHKPHCKG